MLAKVLATGEIVKVSKIKAHEGLYIDNDNNVYKKEELSFEIEETPSSLPQERDSFGTGMRIFDKMIEQLDPDLVKEKAEQEFWRKYRNALVLQLIGIYETKVYCRTISPKEIIDEANEYIRLLKES